MDNVLEIVNKGKILLSDGAWGTMLFEKGLKTGDCPESLNLINPKVVYEVAKSYADAGADIITTNSFGASVFKLEHYSLEDKVKEINIKAAEISRKAAGENKYVFGSIGPTGKILMMGDVSEEELYEDFKIRASSLEKGGANAILIETLTAIDEAVIAIAAAKENTSLPVACTFTFDKIVTGEFRTMMGVSPKDMIDALVDARADIIGSNCGNGFDRMIEIADEMRSINSEIPILIQANAGMPCLVDDKSVFPETPQQMSANLKNLIDKGVNIVGGCCGTTPEYISAFAEIIKKHDQ